MRHSITIIILILIIKNSSLSQYHAAFISKVEKKIIEFPELNSQQNKERISPNLRYSLWQKHSFFRGANIHPYKFFTPFSMREPITREDLTDLKKLGANLIVANFPGVFTYFPPFEIDSLHLKNLDRIVQLTNDLKFYLVISIRSGPGRSLYSFYDKKREDEYVIADSISRLKYIDMCLFITDRYKHFNHLVGINFLLEPHSDDPVNIQGISDSNYFDFVNELIKNVREIDQSIPIIVQPLGWAYPDKFSTLKKFDGDKIVYSFDMYFPHSFTNEKNDSSYPGLFFVKDSLVYVDSSYLKEFLKPVIEFKQNYNIPIFVNEYGGIRYKKGFLSYLKDLHNLFIENGFHFAFYVWRSEWLEIDGNSFDDFNYEKQRNLDKKSINEILNEFRRAFKVKN